MLERSVESIVVGVITGTLVLMLEHWSGLFVRLDGNPHRNRFVNLVAHLAYKWHYVLYLPFLALIVLISISNFVYLRVISPRFINTVVIVASATITVALLSQRFSRSFHSLQIPLVLARKPIWLSPLSQRFSRTFRSLQIPFGFARRLIWLWPLLLLLTTFSALAGPRYLVVVLPIYNNSQTSTRIAQRVEQYLQRAGYGQIAIRELPCAGPCPSPDSLFMDSRVLLVISGEVKQQTSGTSSLELVVDANCRRDPSPINEKYNVESDCTYSGTFPFDADAGIAYLDTYLPILLLDAISNTEGSESGLIGLVNQAIDALDKVSSLQDAELAWSLHEKLFDDLLYNMPNLTLKERIDSAGEVRAHAARLPDIDNKLTYLTARWYESSGVIDSNNFEKAIMKYQEIVKGQPDSSHFALTQLAYVSEQLNRYTDAVCYVSEALRLSPNSQDRLHLASLLETLGVPEIPKEANQTAETPEEIRQEVQESAVTRSDASSIREYLSLAEISLNNRNYEDAREYVRKALNSTNLTPAERADAYYLEGRIGNAQSDFEMAIDAWKRFLNLDAWENFSRENFVAGYVGLAYAYHGRGYHSQAAKAYQQALEFAVAQEAKAALLAEAAEERKLAGEIDGSRALFEQAKSTFEALDLDAFPLEVRLAHTGMIYNYSFLVHDSAESSKYYQTIEEFYTSLIDDIMRKASSDFAGCEWLKENLYSEDKNPYDYLRGYSAEPSIPADYYDARREALIKLDRFDEAHTDAHAEIERLKRSAQSASDYYNLGRAYYYIGEYQAAIDAMQQAIERDNPGKSDDFADAADYFMQGLAYQDMHNYAQAVQVLAKAGEIQSKADPLLALNFYEALAQVYISWGKETNDPAKFQNAISANQLAITLPAPNAAKASNWHSIGLSYRMWGTASRDITKLQSAVDAHSHALKLGSPADAAGEWFNVGLTYLEWAKLDSSRYPNAVEAWQQAIRLDNPDATEHKLDPLDVADWHMLAITYKEWARIDPSKYDLALESVIEALVIPIVPSDGDYGWHNAAERLEQELRANK